MARFHRRILYVGAPGAHTNARERALVSSGIGVASVEAPESAVTFVKNSSVQVVLLDDDGAFDVSQLAGCLKVAQPAVRIIALLSDAKEIAHADMVLPKTVEVESRLTIIQQNFDPLTFSTSASN